MEKCQVLYLKNKSKLTRNNDSKIESKTYTHHGHHKSSNNIENPRNGSKFPYNSKLIEESKKRHRRDMKSGDISKPSNFKFMNVNWLNQNNTEHAPSFYANQMSTRGIENHNVAMCQNMDTGQMNNYSNQVDINSIINQNTNGQVQLSNNQSLLVYDKQTHSIIPLNVNMTNQINNPMILNSGYPPTNIPNQSEIDATPSRSILNITLKERINHQNNIPYYLQDAKLNFEMANREEGTPKSIMGNNFMIEKDISGIRVDLEDDQVNLMSKGGSIVASSNKGQRINESLFNLTTKSSLIRDATKDSLNNRLETGIKAIEISKLKASDYDLNNRKSESININHLSSNRKFELSQDIIVEESDNFESFHPNKDQSSDLNKNILQKGTNNEESVMWVGNDANSTKNIKIKKKMMEKRLNRRNKGQKEKSKGRSNDFSESNRDYETGDKVNDSINQFPNSICNNDKLPIHKVSNSSHIEITKKNKKKANQRANPIMVDLMSSEDITGESNPLSHVLESGDNPISSISSKKGLINFKAFQGDSIQKPILEAPIIIGAKDNTNSSLADMFKTKKNNIVNKLTERRKGKSKKKESK